MSTAFHLQVRVYIEDTDAGGIVYYVNYLKFFERARTELLRNLGYDKAALLLPNAHFVVTAADVRYRRSARLDDVLRVTADVVAVTAATVIFEQVVARRDELLASARITIALVNPETGRPRRLTEDLRRALDTYRQSVASGRANDERDDLELSSEQ